MENGSANPIIVALLCVARCMVPLLFMLGISYLLRRFGLVKSVSEAPQEFLDSENNDD